MTDREDLSGRTLGEFVVRERIGSGGFGDVYRCEQPLLGRQAVVKVLHQRLRYNDVVLQRFLREAQLASRLDHPYAAHVYAFGIERDDGLFWIAMELVQGTTLAHWLRDRGPLPLDQLVPFFELVAEVVQTAHDRGIVHRDLKPSNVMVIERAGRLLPKLLDFGIAKLLDEAAAADPLALAPGLLDAAAASLARTRPSASGAGADVSPAGSEHSHAGTTLSQREATPWSGAALLSGEPTPSRRPSVSPETPSRSLTHTAAPSSPFRNDENRPITRVGVPLGSPPYMSPEQWNDAVAVGPSADLYALGVMAYEALTGRRPFDAATIAGYFELHHHAAVPSLGIGFPPALDRLFRRALAKHPDDRWPNALEFAAAFRAASGLSAAAADLPRLDDTVSDAWLASAPQPLAESIAVLDGARNAHQARDAVHDLTRGLVRYLLAIAFAARAHVRDETSDPELIDLVRTLPQRDLTDDDRVRLLRLLVRPLAGRSGAHPIPELVDLVTPNSDDGADGLDGLLALLAATSHAGTSHAGTDDAVRDRLTRVLPDLAHILHRTAFLLDYVLVVPRDQTPERWTGLRRPQRAVTVLRAASPDFPARDAPRSGSPRSDSGRRDFAAPEFPAPDSPPPDLPAFEPSSNLLAALPALISHRRVLDQHPTLLDREGRATVDLWPFAQVESPTEGADPELFLFEGRGRHGALLIAAPAGFEHSDPSIWDWLAMHIIPDVETAADLGSDDQAPYLGLSPFSTSDATRFVGREREVDAMLNRIRQRPLQIVVGASGAGKSSFVHAGVLAALPPHRRVITMRPGTSPLASLQARLADIRPDESIVVVIDQLEELFTLCASADERVRFAAALCQLIAPTEPSVRVICTIRDDFLMQLEALAPLRPLLSPALVLLGNPSRDTLVRILVEPLRRAGYTLSDPTLAHDIVAAVPDRPGALALLSFTASRLWELRDRRFRQLTRSAYEAMGGVGGALGQHAEVTFDALTPTEKQAARDLFRHLVTVDGTRTLATVDDLRNHLGPTRAADVINKLVAARLLSSADCDGESTIEIIHEALIAAWPRLQQWMREDADGARMRDQLRAAARRWRDGGRARGLLWRDDLLTDLDRWLRRTRPALGDIEASFVDACRRRATRKRRWLFGLAAMGLLLVLGAFQLRALQNRVARRLAEARVTQSYAEQGRHALLDGKYTEALIYLAAADRRGDESPVASFMLARAAQPFLAERARLPGTKGRVWSAAFSADGQRIVTTDDQGARLWNAKTYTLIAALPHNAVLYSSAFTPDGIKFVTASSDGFVRLWSVSDGRLIATLTAGQRGHTQYKEPQVSPDGAWIAVADVHGDRAHVWNAHSGAYVTEVEATGTWDPSLVFSHDGRWFAFSGADGAVVVDTQTWKQVVHLPVAQLRTLNFDPTGPRLATGSALGDVSIWSIPDGNRVRRLRDAGAGTNRIAYSPNGALLASGNEDGSERVWDAWTGALRLDLMNHRANVRSIEFDPSSQRIVSGAGDGTVVISDVQAGVVVSVLGGPRGRVNAVHFDRSGQLVIGASWDGTTWVWDASTPYHRWNSPSMTNDCLTDPAMEGDQRFIVVKCKYLGTHVWDTARDQLLADLPSAAATGNDAVAAFPTVSTAGDLAAIGLENIVAVYSLPGGRLVRTLTHPASVTAVAFVPGTRDIVSGSEDGTLLFAAEDGDSIQLPSLPSGIYALGVTADRRVVANGSLGELLAYDLDRKIVLASLGSSPRLAAMRFSADGSRMITVPRMGVAPVTAAPVLWSLDRYQSIAPLEGSIGSLFSARFVRGDREILAASTDGSLRVWDAMTGQLRQRYFGSDQYSFDATLAPDGRTIVAAGSDGVLRFWDAASATLMWALRAHRVGITGVHFDGDNIVTRGGAGELSRWDFSKLPSRQAIDHIVRCLPLRFDDETGRVVEQQGCNGP